MTAAALVCIKIVQLMTQFYQLFMGPRRTVSRFADGKQLFMEQIDQCLKFPQPFTRASETTLWSVFDPLVNGIDRFPDGFFEGCGSARHFTFYNISCLCHFIHLLIENRYCLYSKGNYYCA